MSKSKIQDRNLYIVFSPDSGAEKVNLSFDYRRAVKAELETIAQKYPEHRAYLKSSKTEKNSFILGAYCNNDLIGVIAAHSEAMPHPLEKQYDLFIAVLEVEREHRRKGAAREMIARAEEWAKESGYLQIRTWTNGKRQEAIEMWQALGYTLFPVNICSERNRNETSSGFYAAKRINAGGIIIPRLI